MRACARSQRGIHFLGKGMEGAFAYDDPRALQSLKNLASTGADHIALTFSWYLNGTTSRTNHTSDTDEGWRFSTGPIRPIDGPAPSGLNFANCSTPTDWLWPPAWEHDKDCSLMQYCGYPSNWTTMHNVCKYDQSCAEVGGGSAAVVGACNGSSSQRFAFIAAH